MRDRPGLWRLSALFLVGAAAAAGGCGLVLNYGDFSGTGGSTSATGAGAASGSTASNASSSGPGSGGGSPFTSSGGGSMTVSSSAGSMSVGVGSTSSGSCAGTCLVHDATWTPVLFYEGVTAKPCPSGSALALGGNSLAVPPAMCTLCTCSAPSCPDSYELDIWKSGGTCSGAPSSNMLVDAGTCQNLPSQTSSFMLQEPPTSCAPAGGAATLPPVSWSPSDQTCLATTTVGTCTAGEACIPTTTGFTACISSQPSTAPGPACPTGGPSTRHQFTTSVAEGRGCSPCTCAGGSCIQGFIEISKVATTCGTLLGPTPFNGCYDGGEPAFTVVVPPATGTGATCAPDGGVPVGGVTEGPLVTVVCCPP